MRLSIVCTILIKELTETLRDRRTLLMMFGLPILIYPILLLGVSSLQVSQLEARAARPSRIAVWGKLPPDLERWLSGQDVFVLSAWKGAPAELRSELEAGHFEPPPTPLATPRPGLLRPAMSLAASQPEGSAAITARELLLRREVDAVLVTWPGLGEAMEGGGLGQMTLFYDSVTEDSHQAKERLEADVSAFRLDEQVRRERRLGLHEGFSRALALHPKNVAPPRRRMGQLLGSVLPFLLIVMSVVGGFYPAIDLTAGEKERGTMQTLLCAPLRPVEIIAGKFLAVWMIGWTTSLANVLSLAITLSLVVPSRELVLPLSVYAMTFTLMLPVSFLITAVFLGVASFAKDFKDGQNLLAPLYMVMAFPSAVCLVPGVELSAKMAWVPVLNIALLVKALLQGQVQPMLAFTALLASMLYGGLALALASRVFRHEQVLLGGRVSLRLLFGWRSARAPL